MRRYGIRELPCGERRTLAQEVGARRPGEVEADPGGKQPSDFLQQNSARLGGAFMRERTMSLGHLMRTA